MTNTQLAFAAERLWRSALATLISATNHPPPSVDEWHRNCLKDFQFILRKLPLDPTIQLTHHDGPER